MKTRLRIGQWNVRTLREPSRLAQVENILGTFQIALLGMSEVRWTGTGELLTSNGNLFIYSGREDAATSGVGIIISRQLKNCLMNWYPVSHRIIVARLRSKFRNIAIIQCYAPTEEANECIKDEFYYQLSSTLASMKRGDMIVLMGDMNAKVGRDNTDVRLTMGVHGLGVRNDNGSRLLELCQTHELVIGGTIFPHKDIHKYTWTSPNGRIKNQIDHICIKRKFRSTLCDVRTKRSADIDSDHQLLIAELKAKPMRIRSSRRETDGKLNVEILKNTESIEYKTYYRNIQKELNKLQLNKVEDWESAVKIYKEIGRGILGTQTKLKKPWITSDTWRKIEIRSELKKKMINGTSGQEEIRNQYVKAAKEVKKNARNDKRKYYSGLAQDAQDAAEKMDIKRTYINIKKLTGKHLCKDQPLKSSNGDILTSAQDQRARWKEYFESMLNDNLNINQSIQENIITYDSEATEESTSRAITENSRTICQAPTKQEVKCAIMKIKNNKAAGIDGLQAEVLKYDIETAVNVAHPVIEMIWSKEDMPSEWKQGIIVKIPKKGDLKECHNWRGITLLSVISKILANILQKRLQENVEGSLRDEQAGFRPNRSCIDQSNTLRLIVEQSVEWNSSLCVLFVDFEKAFDSIDRNFIWKALQIKRVPAKLIKMIQMLYNNTKCAVLHKGEVSDSFNINRGVKQGCPLSPLLFTIALDIILQRTMQERETRGIQWTLTSHLHDLDYADDICLLTHSVDDMQRKINLLVRHAQTAGLKINCGKTKCMRLNTRKNTAIMINGETIEDVTSFCYLGSIITIEGGSNEDIDSRVKKARNAFGALSKLWSAKAVTRNTKLQIFNACVKSVLLYGCETWCMKKANYVKIQVFVNKCLRRICGVYWPNMVSNDDLWRICKMKTMRQEIFKRKWSWIGHTLRKPANSVVRKALEWNPQGHRYRGRPRKTWRRTVSEELAAVGKSWSDVKKIAPNRVRWKVFVEALHSPVE